MSGNRNPLLIVENDPTDIMIFKRALNDLRYTFPVDFAADGNEALRYLEDPERIKPWLIFLDLNTPRMNGLEMLERLRKIQRTHWIPIVVVSTSENPDDINCCLDRGACGYLLKEFEYTDFKESVRTAVEYWARCRTPSRCDTLALR
ncbi:response regulator [bacterium]|nr:response regulator [candidate division CSSED10-310 bacterium]